MEIGIVGLPNVGKSTLFNALLKKQAALAANYPFATIEPNVGVVPVPDDRLAQLAKVVGTTKLVNATVKFVDIAGLVKGASQGEGLGNKFLAHIREVDAIMFILRDFSDENIIRAGSTDPKSDQEILETELILADLETAKKIQDTKDKDIKILGNRIVSELEKGTPIRALQFTESEEKAVKQMSFLTNKPVIVVMNTDEDRLNSPSVTTGPSLKLREGVGGELRISAKLESELAELSDDEQKDYLKQLGIEKSGLELVIQKAFDVLGLQTFLTAGEKEARAWTIKKGSTAPQAAGVIHNDFEKHFIKAECVNFNDFIQHGGWAKCRELGKVRMEGRDYIMQEGDVVEFKVGV